MDEGREAEAVDARVNTREVAGRNGRLLPAEAEAGGARPGMVLVKIENAVSRSGAPLADGVKKDAKAAAGASLVVGEDGLKRVPHGKPGEAHLFDEDGRDVDLGVSDPFAPEPGDEVGGNGGIVRGALQAAADVSVEGEETPETGPGRPPGPDGGDVRENGAGPPAGKADERGRGDGALEVKVKLGFGSGPEAEEKPAGGVGGEHAAPSYGAPPPGVVPRGRLWIRASAFGVDLLLLAGGPLLLSTVVIVAILLYSAEPPPTLGRGFVAAQGVFAVLFLLRDTGGGSPGKRLFGLRLVRERGRPVGFLASIARNLPMLVPGWNLIELLVVIRRADGRRGGDRLAGTTLLEA